jgi:hypothetical protein
MTNPMTKKLVTDSSASPSSVWQSTILVEPDKFQKNMKLAESNFNGQTSPSTEGRKTKNIIVILGKEGRLPTSDKSQLLSPNFSQAAVNGLARYSKPTCSA